MKATVRTTAAKLCHFIAVYFIFRPPRTVVAGRLYVLQQFFILSFFRREISEVRGPIFTTFCHIVESMFSLQMPVRKFGGVAPKNRGINTKSPVLNRSMAMKSVIFTRVAPARAVVWRHAVTCVRAHPFARRINRRNPYVCYLCLLVYEVRFAQWRHKPRDRSPVTGRLVAATER